MTDEYELTLEERAALARIRQDAMPPPRVEEEILDSLRHVRAIGRPRIGWRVWMAAVAATVAGFAAGLSIARLPQAASTQPKFVLLLYAGDETGRSEERHSEYAAWARTVAADGRSIAGEELADGSEEITNPDSAPAASMTDQPRGYFVISARDADEARRIAATCPHLRHGGRIVLRRVVS